MQQAKVREVLKPLTVIGAGSWGTALAVLLARNGQSVRLWDHQPKHISDLYHKRINTRYLPGVALPDALELFGELSEALQGVDDILIAVPSHAFRDILLQIKPFVTAETRVVWGTKGIDPTSGKLLHEVTQELLGKIPMAILAGPSFAKEVALGLPTAITIANNDAEFAKELVERLHNPVFRVYTTEDMIGAQICGAVKNVLAIAVGASDGLGFGANARCALITRGLAEMARLGIAMGGQQETFMGLAGIGDFVLTATDDQSRNRRFGLALGSGKNLEQVRKEIGQVVEGASNAISVYELAKKFQVEMPITQQVNRVLNENVPIIDAVKTLLSRGPTKEFI